MQAYTPLETGMDKWVSRRKYRICWTTSFMRELENGKEKLERY